MSSLDITKSTPVEQTSIIDSIIKKAKKKAIHIFLAIAGIVGGLLLLFLRYIKGNKNATKAVNANNSLNKELQTINLKIDDQVIDKQTSKEAADPRKNLIKKQPKVKDQKVYDKLQEERAKLVQQINTNNEIINNKPGFGTMFLVIILLLVGVINGFIIFM